ncbi:MAG: MerR family transcriptional regulator [Propionicimonas sp.]|uniref:heat shock protein transcriptional repressor HspR n=1 Tax=Propionicimonas sp. TaxID=1955623 RepID=UPI002B1FC207|nr:MerR family transcriptional regulator [Propionicimonas sp.]MEA4944735.1 MerR family transcriptional regulator [Propionicimonas sp.]MEA5052532.1 MerR family transcriptional regulator [Propionicimonas sp.]
MTADGPARLPDRIDPDAPIFVISVAAQLAEMHPQTLRGYDRLGLVVPGRARGRGRRYSLRDIAKLRHIQHLSQTEGINLEGIRRILELEAELEDVRQQVAQLTTLVQHLHLTGGETRLFTAAQTGEVHLGRVRVRTPRAITR